MRTRVADTPERLLIRSSPPVYWVWGVILVGLGALCMLAAAGLVGAGGMVSPRTRLGAVLLGTVAAAVGAWICWRAPLSSLVVDSSRKTLTITRRRLLGKATEQYPTTDIADVRVTKERTGKSAPRYRVELVLVSGSVVPISLLHPRDREGCMRAAERLGAVLDLPRP
jgi:hypothetical protein